MQIDLSLPKSANEILPILISTVSNSGIDCKVDLFNSFLNSLDVQTDPLIMDNYPPFNKLKISTGGNYLLSQSIVANPQGSIYAYKDLNNFTAIVGIKTPYVSILKYLQSNQFHVKAIRISGNSNAQILTSFKIKQNDVFGNYKDIKVYPDTFISPMQVQSKIINLDIDFIIDGFTSIEYDMTANNYVNFEFIMR